MNHLDFGHKSVNHIIIKVRTNGLYLARPNKFIALFNTCVII